MIQLGISAFYHDSAACLVKDGKVISAVEEERFTETKHDSSFPINSIKWILENSKLSLKDVDQVCWYENPSLKKDRVLKSFQKKWWKTFKIRKKFLKEHRANNIPSLLKTLGYEGEIVYTDHHLSHASYSYFTSPFKNALVLTVDGVGEWETVTLYHGEGNRLTKLNSIYFPNSLGMLYSTITSFLGFKPNEGEYKVMGLAPYGNSKRYLSKFSQLITPAPDGKFELNMNYFSYDWDDKAMFNKNLPQLFGIPNRFPGEEITQDHKDLAATLQHEYEYYFFRLINNLNPGVKSKNICLGGGCAYNGAANGKVLKNSTFSNLWIPPAPSDAGSAIGACLYNYRGARKLNTSPYLGPSFSKSEIEDIVKDSKLKYRKYRNLDKLTEQVASLLYQDKIVGWFQGRMEFGARALGNRSILANPLNSKMREKLNMVIKKRESFRPFAPSVLIEDVNNYFLTQSTAPYMNQIVEVRDGVEVLFPAAVHIDRTARIQAVDKKANPVYYLLLEKFKQKSGHGVLLNTSFNLKDQTITLSPTQAIQRFKSSEIDYLVLENYLIEKIYVN